MIRRTNSSVIALLATCAECEMLGAYALFVGFHHSIGNSVTLSVSLSDSDGVGEDEDSKLSQAELDKIAVRIGQR